MTFNTCKKIGSIKNDNGVGSPSLISWQKVSGNHVAIRFEGIFAIFIYDRQGQYEKKIIIPTNCTGLAWDADGDTLAIMLDTPGSVLLWDVHSQKLTEIETGLKDSGSNLAWSNVGKILALGTHRGNLLVYNHRNLRKIPIVGNHSKKVTCVAWSKGDLLAFGTLDEQISLNGPDGEFIKIIPIRGKPTDLQFGLIKEDQATNIHSDNAVSCIVNDKVLLIQKFDDPRAASLGSPMELGFQPKYGYLFCHNWHGDGYIIVAFSGGYIVLLSSHPKEIGTELVLCDLKDDVLRCCSLNLKQGWLAICCGQSTFQVHEARNPKHVLSITDAQDDDGRLRPLIQCHWSDDGQLLAVSNTAGDVHIYLTSVPMLGGFNYGQVVIMSSLTDCVLYNLSGGQLILAHTINLHMEPNRLVLGPSHLVAIIHNVAQFYNCREDLGTICSIPVITKEFNANIHDFVINHKFCGALCGDKAFLHLLDNGSGDQRQSVKSFLEKKVTCLAMTKELFIYGLDSGLIKIFSLEHWMEILCLKVCEGIPIKAIHPDPSGGQVLTLNKHSEAFYIDVLSPKYDSDRLLFIHKVKDFPSKCDSVLWDMDYHSRHIFIAHQANNTKVHLFSAWKENSEEPNVILIGKHDILKTTECKPFLFKKGSVYAYTGTGKATKSTSLYEERVGEETISVINRLCALRQFPEALSYCNAHPDKDNWEVLAKFSLNSGLFDYATKANLALKEYGILFTFNDIELDCEDIAEVEGDIALCNQEDELAEELYILSCEPEKAVELAIDLQDWNRAWQMTDRTYSKHAADITIQVAKVSEQEGNFEKALIMYQKAQLEEEEFEGLRILTDKDMEYVLADKSKTWLVLKAMNDRTDYISTKTKNQMDRHVKQQIKNQTEGKVPVPHPHLKDITSIQYIQQEIKRGIIRNYLKIHRFKEGLELLNTMKNKEPKFLNQVAEIFEKAQELETAISLYLEAGNIPKAIICHVVLKQFDQAQALLLKQGRQGTREIWRFYAKALEKDGKLIEAGEAYGEGDDYKNGVRVFLKIDLPEEARRYARDGNDNDLKRACAHYYLEKGHYESALEELVAAGFAHDAYQVAITYGLQEMYGACVYTTYTQHYRMPIPTIFTSYMRSIADDLYEKKDYYRAGVVWVFTSNYEYSIPSLIKAIQTESYPQDEVIAQSHETLAWSYLKCAVSNYNEPETNELFARFILGEHDGRIRDFRHLYEFYALTKQAKNAARTAMSMAEQATQSGKVREAHSALLSAIMLLISIREPVSNDMWDAFTRLHSYTLLRFHKENGNFVYGARMAIRLRNHLECFNYTCRAGILQLGATYCASIGLPSVAKELATQLWQDKKTRYVVDKKQIKSIEDMMRKKQPKDTIQMVIYTPCPYCKAEIDTYCLTCPECLSRIPICIASGKHLEADNMTSCHGCNMPCNYSETVLIQKYIKQHCPACNMDWRGENFIRINDPTPYLQPNVLCTDGKGQLVYVKSTESIASERPTVKPTSSNQAKLEDKVPQKKVLVFN